MHTAMLPPASSLGCWSQQISFTVVSGFYSYFREYADDAAEGMYGGFVVA